jgi:IS30 family transposase
MYTSPKNYQQLQSEDRMTIPSLRQQNFSIRRIAEVLERSPATVSRKLRRNSDEGVYASVSAQQSCRQSRQERKLHPRSVLFGMVRTLLCSRWSPEQIALTLARLYPKGHKLRVSHEIIYNCIYAQPVGDLRKELIANLHQARNKRAPRSNRQDRRSHIPDMLSIHVRPPEVEDRQFPGHREGDLIKGESNASAVGALVERTSRLLMLVKLLHLKPASAANVPQAFTDKLCVIAQPMRKTLAYDQGKEMALHKQLTANTGMAVYFCNPHSPWQRGSNENTNGLFASTCPKGPTCRTTAKSIWMPLSMKSTIDLAKAWGTIPFGGLPGIVPELP